MLYILWHPFYVHNNNLMLIKEKETSLAENLFYIIQSRFRSYVCRVEYYLKPDGHTLGSLLCHHIYSRISIILRG